MRSQLAMVTARLIVAAADVTVAVAEGPLCSLGTHFGEGLSARRHPFKHRIRSPLVVLRPSSQRQHRKSPRIYQMIDERGIVGSHLEHTCNARKATPFNPRRLPQGLHQ